MATRSARASATSSDPAIGPFRNIRGKAYVFPLFCGGLRAQGLGLAGRSEEGASRSGVRARPRSGSCIIGPVWQLPSVNQRERIIKGMHLAVAGMTTDARAFAPRGLRTRTPSAITPPTDASCATRRFHRNAPLRRVCRRQIRASGEFLKFCATRHVGSGR